VLGTLFQSEVTLGSRRHLQKIEILFQKVIKDTHKPEQRQTKRTELLLNRRILDKPYKNE